MEHGVEVVAVMAAETSGGSGVRSDVLFAFLLIWSAGASDSPARRPKIRYSSPIQNAAEAVNIDNGWSVDLPRSALNASPG